MDNISDIANVVMAFGTIVGLIYIAGQTSNTRKQAFGQFLFELDTRFQVYKDLHAQLMDSEEEFEPTDEDMPIIWQYVGLFERCKILIDHSTITLEVFDDLYGYRLYSVVANSKIRESIKLSHKRHRLFIQLCHDVVSYKKREKCEKHDLTFEQQVTDFPHQKPKDWRYE